MKGRKRYIAAGVGIVAYATYGVNGYWYTYGMPWQHHSLNSGIFFNKWPCSYGFEIRGHVGPFKDCA